MVARELQHAPRDSRGFLRGLSEPWAIPRTVYGGSATLTPLADRLAWFWPARLTPKFWQRVPVSDRNSRGLVLLRVGFGRKTEKGKARSGQQANVFVVLRLRSVTAHLALGCSCSCRATLDAWRSEATSVRPNRFRTPDLPTFPRGAHGHHPHPSRTHP